MKRVFWGLLGAFIFMGQASLWAVYKMGVKKPVQIRKESSRLSPKAKKDPASRVDEELVLVELSKRFSVGIDQLKYFRSLYHGYEEIVPALIIAREAQVESGKILNHRMERETWKQIADKYDVDLEPLNKEVLDVLAPLRKRLSKKQLMERPKQRSVDVLK